MTDHAIDEDDGLDDVGCSNHGDPDCVCDEIETDGFGQCFSDADGGL